MRRARIKKDIFKKCESVILSTDEYVTTYAGLNHNPYVPYYERDRQMFVQINDRWWKVDSSDWDRDGDDDFDPVNYRNTRKYIRHGTYNSRMNTKPDAGSI